MSGFLRQSTAAQTRLIGPFVDDTDFKTAETGLTISNTDIKLRANGTLLSNKNSGGAAHQVNGNYSVTWDATDTANVGELAYSVAVAGVLQVWGAYTVLEEVVFDALCVSGAPGYLQPTVAGRTLDVSAAGEAGLDWANIGAPTTAQNLSATNIDVDQVVASVSGAVGSVGAGGITAASITDASLTAAKFAAGAFDAVWTVATRTLTSFGTLVADVATAVWAAATRTLTAFGFTADANLVSVNSQTAPAGKLERSSRTIVLGTVAAGASTTVIPTSSLAPAAAIAGQFNGRVVIFDETTATTTLRGCAATIQSSSAGGILTILAAETLPTAPASGDTFVII